MRRERLHLGPVQRADANLARGIADPERERALVRLPSEVKDRVPHLQRGLLRLRATQPRGRCRGFPRGVRAQSAGEIESLAVRDDEFLAAASRGSRKCSARSAPTAPASGRAHFLRLGERRQQRAPPSGREERRRDGPAPCGTRRGRPAGNRNRLGFLRDLPDGGAQQGRGDIRRQRARFRQLDDALQPVAKTAEMALEQLRELRRPTPLPEPMPRPALCEPRRDDRTAQREKTSQDARRIHETVANEEQQIAGEQPNAPTRHRRQRLHLPQASLEAAQLRDQRIRQGERVHGAVDSDIPRASRG